MSGMSAEKLGEALVTVAMISRQLGHGDMFCTARDYLMPHVISGFLDATEEMLFVLCALTGGQPLTEEEAVALIQSRSWPPLHA